MEHQDECMDYQLLVSLSEKYGSPLYVYDADTIISQYNRLTEAFSTVDKLKLNYAVKANSNVSILKLFNKLESGIDTVSIQEVQLGLEAGFAPENIIFTPNGVSLQELEDAANLGVQINIDNISILEQFAFVGASDSSPVAGFYQWQLVYLRWEHFHHK